MPRQKKYRKGRCFRSMMEFHWWVSDKERWVYWRDRPKHPSVIMNMTYLVVRNAVRRGTIIEAIPTEGFDK